MNDFEEARNASEDMISEQMTLDDAVQAEETSQEVPEEPVQEPAEETMVQGETSTDITPQQQMLDQATQTAETAAQVAAQKDAELQGLMAQLEAANAEKAQMQATIVELSKKNEEHIIEEALAPPTLDISGLAFADEETQKAAMAKYAEDMSAYNRQQLMKEMSPVLEYAKKGMRDVETKEVVSALSQIPELANIQEMLPQLDRIIANNKWLQSEDMPTDEKYINAYAMARGIDTINNPPAPPEPAKEPTPEELLAIYNSNPAFQELVEKQRVEEIKKSQQVPSFSASSGAVNAALNIKDKPKSFEESLERSRKYF